MPDTLYNESWLIVSKSGRYGKAAVRLAKTIPTLNPGEIPVKLKLEIPAVLFEQPQFVAQITVPEPSGIYSDVEIKNTLAEISDEVKNRIGISVTFNTENGNG